jgi:anti-anti-sigma factor
MRELDRNSECSSGDQISFCRAARPGDLVRILGGFVAAVDEAQPAPIAVTGLTGADGELVITIAGELDMSNVDVARNRLDGFLAAGPTSIVVDLAELTFMDSSGIALLIQTASRVEHLSLRHVPGLVERVLEATGVAQLLAVER